MCWKSLLKEKKNCILSIFFLFFMVRVVEMSKKRNNHLMNKSKVTQKNRQIMLQMIRKVPLHVLKTYSLKWRKTCFARKIKWKPFSIFEWLDNTRQLVIMSKTAYNFMRKFLAHTNHRLYFVKRKKTHQNRTRKLDSSAFI